MRGIGSCDVGLAIMASQGRCDTLVGAALRGSSGGFEGWAGIDARDTRMVT